MDDPTYSERHGGLPDSGWEKAALRTTLGQDIYKCVRPAGPAVLVWCWAGARHVCPVQGGLGLVARKRSPGGRGQCATLHPKWLSMPYPGLVLFPSSCAQPHLGVSKAANTAPPSALCRLMRNDHEEETHLPGSYLLPPDATPLQQAYMEFSLVRVRALEGAGCRTCRSGRGG